MKKYLLFTISLAFAIVSNAQLAPHKYLVKFTDKNNSPYSISNPSSFLSVKAITRRLNQGITIKYNDLPVSPAYVDSIINTGVTLLCKSKWFNSVTIYTTDSLALAKIQSFPFVVGIDSVARINKNSQNPIFAQNNKLSPIDLSGKSAEYQNNNYANAKINSYDYGFAFNQISMISADFLHNHEYCGQGMTIAVIDAGFWNVDSLSVFDSLWINNQILGFKDFVEPGGDVFRKHVHGMMVLSIMGGNIPGQIVGTAPKANYWLLRSEDAATENIIEEYNWASAAEFADSVGADVINSSLGYTVFDAPWMDHTYSDMNGHTAPGSIAAAIAASKGIIVCNSAGNSGSDTWHYIGCPADADSILTVGAVDNKKKYASFSSTGPTADGRIKPTVVTQGQGTYVANTQGGVVSGSGTSFSSPVLAGAVACLWQAFPSKTYMQIIEAIKKSASQFNNPDSLLGYGIPNFAAACLILAGTIHNVNVFPNPFSNILHILFYSDDIDCVDIDIFDITGKKVYSEAGLHRNTGYNYFSIGKVSNIAKGLYIIRISSNGNIFSRKLMKVE
ncbi:MAG: S8 family serine peptidase [Bacteroidales bacterium]